ncbi:MAG: aminotransferase class IV [Cyclobacteriaceae bacterium]|nr:aminotransferase class IV [Cyclobacteriaceae bacterium]MCX7638452.1 aminotransferase class IV [Cyclobacteriaceae bacterium]MDW8331193.1 aminotransferase class IV [Cyclobacteriaceae bacterium]
MYRLIESIRLENGKFFRLHHHQQRMDETITALTGKDNPIQLSKELSSHSFPKTGLFKCRLVYGPEEVLKTDFIPYVHQQPVWMQVVCNDSVSYNFKFEDRSWLEPMKPSRLHADIIIIRKGKVTDASYSNLVFFDGKRWLTPAEPLLSGTMRKALLEAGEIFEEEIREEDLRRFKKVKRINAMLQFDEPALPASQIIW